MFVCAAVSVRTHEFERRSGRKREVGEGRRGHEIAMAISVSPGIYNFMGYGKP